MTENSTSAAVILTSLSVVRKENSVMKVVSADSGKQQKTTVKDRIVISSKGYIAAPAHDFL